MVAGGCDVACYKPLHAWITPAGGVVFESSKTDTLCSVDLPCGRCVGCRVERARQWTVRVMHEASLYEENCFVTLTYDDDHVPPGGGLRHEDFQGFLKRLRARVHPRMVRFFMCGEYGEERGRPHFHAALFNYSFPDRVLWRKLGSRSYAYRSATLESVWPFGLSSIGDLTRKSAAYMARYIHKVRLGDDVASNDEAVDGSTGEVVRRRGEYIRMSLRPGIGAYWFRLYGSTDVFPHDRVVVDGRPCVPPRFYEKLHKRVSPDGIEQVKLDRIARARSRFDDNTPERLHAKEVVAKARVDMTKRRLK